MSTYEISKSSLLSLKAEILRKQEDLIKTKADNAEKIKVIKKKTPLELKNKGIEDRKKNDLDDEERDLLKLSSSKLQQKAILYDKLSGKVNNTDEVNRKYLVRFDKKEKVSNDPPNDCEESSDLLLDNECNSSIDIEDALDSSEQWVEYVDCLGRSRKCLREDLDYFKSKDEDLRLAVQKKQEVEVKDLVIEEQNNEANNANEDSHSQEPKNEVELVLGQERREMLRQQWEREEEELQNKSDIHYQNILFNEARQHGVGYYAFSKDEEQRAQQQEALKKLREETERQQKRAQDMRALREKQMAVRIRAARNRQRARLGLPPEDEPITLAVQEKEAQIEEEEQSLEKEEKEKLAMEARKSHIRPWDIGKEGVKEHYQMTQEEWNEKKRLERPVEFAPPKVYNTREFSHVRPSSENVDENYKTLKFSTKKEKRETHIENVNKNEGHKMLRPFSKHSDLNYVPENPTDHDELSQSYHILEKHVEVTNEGINQGFRKRVTEIPSYNDVTHKKRLRSFPKEQCISDAIDAGLKLLRQQVENKET